MSVGRTRLSSQQARRIALRAQQFGLEPPSRVTGLHLRALLRKLGAIQIDSVNVLVRSHYLPAFSRLGSYDCAALERMMYRNPRRAFEYWGHAASVLPIEIYPLMRWRMDGARDRSATMWSHVARVGHEKPELVGRVLQTITERGPMSASDFEGDKAIGGWWGWNETKNALEFLFWAGELTAFGRRTSFERVYDLTERVIPPKARKLQVEEEIAQAQLIGIAAQAYGIATEADLRDYFRIPVAAAKSAISRLVDSGSLIAASVDGWKQPAYLHATASVPRSIEGSALLSPFDSLVWNRERTHRLFHFHYRLEIYTPAHKRVHGYYVLPYLIDDALVARVDLKADRQGSALVVQAVHYEPGVRECTVRARLRDDLAKMADWLGLGRVKMR